MSARHLWDAKFAHDWLRDQLIPEALSWHQRKVIKKSIWKRIKNIFFPKQFEYSAENYITSNLSETMDEYVAMSSEQDLLNHVSELQSFYNCSPESVYIDAIAHRGVFSALKIIIEHSSCKDFRYIKGNLSYLKGDNKAELLSSVNDQSLTIDHYCDNPFKLDCIFRSMMACIKDETYLNHTEIQTVFVVVQQTCGVWTNRCAEYLEWTTSFALCLEVARNAWKSCALWLVVQGRDFTYIDSNIDCT